MKPWIALSSLLVSFAVAATVIAADPAATVKARKDLMGTNSDSIKMIMAAVKSGKVGAKEIAAAATIHANASKIPGLFPSGTGREVIKTRAKDEIWKNFAQFESRAGNLSKVAAAFEAAAKSGNAGATSDAMRTLVGACNACHKQFGGRSQIKVK